MIDDRGRLVAADEISWKMFYLTRHLDFRSEGRHSRRRRGLVRSELRIGEPLCGENGRTGKSNNSSDRFSSSFFFRLPFSVFVALFYRLFFADDLFLSFFRFPG